MSQPSQLLKDAKDRAALLAEALKGQDPWARGIAKQRKELRQVYLKLLLLYPYTDESKDAQTSMWMSTSYALISIFKQRISSSESSHTHASTTAPPGHQPQPGQPTQKTHENYRKLLDQFHRFLSDENRFWRHVVLRIQHDFALDEILVIIKDLGLVSEEPTRADALVLEMFPTEDEVNKNTILTENRQRMGVAMLGKALVCLGDLARYKEQYSESRGRPRAGYEVGPPASRGGRGRRGGGGRGSSSNTTEPAPQLARERFYELAQKFYLAARRLMPSDGNPSHQLAILESYRKDGFGTLLHYVRSLCVEVPYDPGASNMASMLRKALEAWKVRQREENAGQVERTRGNESPKERIDRVKDDVVVLHALWKFGGDKNGKVTARLSRDIIEAFRGLLAERHLPDWMIRDVIVVAQGAFWRRSDLHNTKSSAQDSRLVSSSTILLHVMGLHRALWEVAHAEVVEGTRGATPNQPLDEKITAKLRRMLEATRETLRWTRVNVDFLSGTGGAGIAASTSMSEVTAKRLRAESRKYWDTLASLLTALENAFDVGTLPGTKAVLAEDVELQGFLPLQLLPKQGETNGMNGVDVPGGLGLGLTAVSELHPNEEHLMRVRDILRGGEELTHLTLAPLVHSDGRYSANKHFVQAHEPEERVDASSSEAMQDGDDDANLIEDVMQTVLQASHQSAERDEEDDDGEYILWNPGASPPQNHAFSRAGIPTSPMQPSSPQNLAFAQPGIPTSHVKPLSPLRAHAITLLDTTISPPGYTSPGSGTAYLPHDNTRPPQNPVFARSGVPSSPMQPLGPPTFSPPGHTSAGSGAPYSPYDYTKPKTTALDLLAGFRPYPTPLPQALSSRPQPHVDVHSQTEHTASGTGIPSINATSSLLFGGRSPTDVSLSQGSIWSTAADEPLASPITRTRTLSYNHPQGGPSNVVGGPTGVFTSTGAHIHPHGHVHDRPSYAGNAMPAFPSESHPFDPHPYQTPTTGQYVGQQYHQHPQQEYVHAASHMQPTFSPRAFLGVDLDPLAPVGHGQAYGGAGRDWNAGFAQAQYYDQTFAPRR